MHNETAPVFGFNIFKARLKEVLGVEYLCVARMIWSLASVQSKVVFLSFSTRSCSEKAAQLTMNCTVPHGRQS